MDSQRFVAQIESCQQTIHQILESHKFPASINSPTVFYDDLPHHYFDKFNLTDLLTNLWISSNLTCLSNFGITSEIFQTIIQWSQDSSVTLRFKSIEKAIFLREIEKKYDSNHQLVVEAQHSRQGFNDFFRMKKYVTVKEYEWKFLFQYQIEIFRGNGVNSPEDTISLVECTSQHILSIATNDIFRPEMTIRPNLDVDLTWLLQHVSLETMDPNFEINRNSKDCHTPRRNSEINSAVQYLTQMMNWTQQVLLYFRSNIFPLQIHYTPPHTSPPDLSSINTNGMFAPILPFYIAGGSNDSENGNFGIVTVPSSDENLLPISYHLPTPNDVSQFLAHHSQTIHRKFRQINETFPLPSSSIPPLLNAQTVNFQILLMHLEDIHQLFLGCLSSIETNLRKQFIKAIGKEIQPKDFSDFMIFHNKKLFLDNYQTKPFCYSIRKSLNHTPEGTISIEDKESSTSTSTTQLQTLPNLIYSFVNLQGQENISSSPVMSFPINSAISVSFRGERYLHGYLRHSFSSDELGTQNESDSNSSSKLLRMNSIGNVSLLSYDNSYGHGSTPKYYCGRYVGRYPSNCGSCDGFCGPSNGCQCDSCSQLHPADDISSDLLVKCENGHQLHEVDQSNHWICDATSEPGGCLTAGTQSDPRLFANMRRYRCSGGCDFDYCYNCHQRHIEQHQRSLLQRCPTRVSCPLGHPLQLTDLKNSWFCDHSREIGGCPTTNSVQAMPNGFQGQHHVIRWRCSEGCDFDYCGNCYAEQYRQQQHQQSITQQTPKSSPAAAAGGGGGGQLTLIAQTRQYCNYILLLGRMTSGQTFDPKYGVILQNKDSIEIPLDLETIPSLKEFNDLIASLSEKQQDFLKAYRSMQLEGSVFGVCVIQIKPLLEQVLNLPDDSLVQEIELTERIMKLILQYEIPSSLLSYDGRNLHPREGEGERGREVISLLRISYFCRCHDSITRRKSEDCSTKCAGGVFLHR
jgi:hypothetical protein